MSGQNQFLLYTAPDGAVKVEVFFKDESLPRFDTVQGAE